MMTEEEIRALLPIVNVKEYYGIDKDTFLDDPVKAGMVMNQMATRCHLVGFTQEQCLMYLQTTVGAVWDISLMNDFLIKQLVKESYEQ